MNIRSNKKYLIVVIGPTAVGKTTLCVQLGKYLNAEVLSADSRQFYKGLCIGTAKPTLEEMEGVSHHFLSFLPIDTIYSAGEFEKDALNRIKSLFLKSPYVLLTGGSGLYIRAVCEGFSEIPPINPMIREKLNSILHQEGLEFLNYLLITQDPTYYNEVDLKNPQRVMRALEVCLGTGLPYSFFRKQKGFNSKRPFQIIKIGLFRNKPNLIKRIENRVDTMILQGFIEEADSFYAYRHYNALQTLGYQEIFNYLSGRYGKEDALLHIKMNTRKYAKRQLTWFKKDPTIRWFHPDDLSQIITYINNTAVLLFILFFHPMSLSFLLFLVF